MLNKCGDPRWNTKPDTSPSGHRNARSLGTMDELATWWIRQMIPNCGTTACCLQKTPIAAPRRQSVSARVSWRTIDFGNGSRCLEGQARQVTRRQVWAGRVAGLGLLSPSPASPIPLIFHILQQRCLQVRYHIHIWQLPPQHLAVVAPVKYECDSKDRIIFSTKSKLFCIVGLMHETLATFTPMNRLWHTRVLV